jgi:hypothetical protein
MTPKNQITYSPPTPKKPHGLIVVSLIILGIIILLTVFLVVRPNTSNQSPLPATPTQTKPYDTITVDPELPPDWVLDE